MEFYSPLRYPGGKNKLAKFIAKICEKNNINGHYVEPYSGSASVALHLLINKYIYEITINDIDRSIYAFWYSVLHHTNRLCDLIIKTEINIENWKENREIQKNKEKSSLLKLGFSTLFLNRTNISGIISGGVIGGLEQRGKYKIDCRFNKEEIVRRIRKIAKYKKNIYIYNLDAIELIELIQKESRNSSTIFYFDPPYYIKGKSLYVNYYKDKDHLRISEEIKKINNYRWIVSYDNVPWIKSLYDEFKNIEYSFWYTAHAPKRGNEILFFDKSLIIPKVDDPIKI